MSPERPGNDAALPPRLSGEALHRLGPFLVLDDLRAGDVLLTLGVTFSAGAVAAFSGGAYSHAAIWLPPERVFEVEQGRVWPMLQLVESDPLGVGPTALEFLHLYDNPSTRRMVARLPGVRAAVLLRHPEIAALPDADLYAAAAALAQSEFYKSYAAADRLIGPSTVPSAMRPFAQALFSLANKKDVTAGAFCSELVAKFYASLGLTLFDQDRPPDAISPSHLALAGSRLLPVDGATVLPAHLGQEAYAEAPDFPTPEGLQRHVLLPGLVKQSHTVRTITEKTGDFRTRMAVILAEQNAVARAQHERTIDKLKTYAAAPEIRPGWTRTMLGQLIRALQLRALDARLEPLEVSDARPDDRALHCALLGLRHDWGQGCARASHEVVRSEAITSMRHFRKAGRGHKGERRTTARAWRKIADGRTEMLAAVSDIDLFSSSPDLAEAAVGPQCRAYRQQIIHSAIADGRADLAAWAEGVNAIRRSQAPSEGGA